jgi:hypothetical protein
MLCGGGVGGDAGDNGRAGVKKLELVVTKAINYA